MGRPTKHDARYANVGRKTVMTPEVLGKLEIAFSHGATDVEACYFADIEESTLYAYQKKNPEFKERKDGLKSMLRFRAKMRLGTVISEGEVPDAIECSQYVLDKTDPDFKTTEGGNVNTGTQILINNQQLNPKLKTSEELLRIASSPIKP